MIWFFGNAITTYSATSSSQAAKQFVPRSQQCNIHANETAQLLAEDYLRGKRLMSCYFCFNITLNKILSAKSLVMDVLVLGKFFHKITKPRDVPETNLMALQKNNWHSLVDFWLNK